MPVLLRGHPGRLEVTRSGCGKGVLYISELLTRTIKSQQFVEKEVVGQLLILIVILLLIA